ncbi:SDR family oxidoreductase [Gemmatimonas sp.]|uniref:SDR family NAD(P)-dependent oxidoreductase n=1 Tax=Gemmatimonas sp. TaxID=1962908 RepID=UPI00286C98B8|nr:SDR family oxidoreductase [Gemmatimonas sp.]
MTDALDFSGKLIVITGVGRAGQVGEAVALAFAQRGATLALLDVQPAEVEARAAWLTAQGFTATAHVANLSDANVAKAAADQVVQQTQAQFGGQVHAVICAAGGFGITGPISDADPAAWSKQFMINLETAFGATRAFLPAVRAAKGSFVYFGSVAALPGGSPKGMAAYAAAKSGVLTLMRAVAAEEKPYGVRANAVAPTAVRTAANLADMGDNTEYVDRESVADVIAFLASELARNVSGQVITLA